MVISFSSNLTILTAFLCVHLSFTNVYNQLNENERSSYYPAIQSASSAEQTHNNHFANAHTTKFYRKKKDQHTTRGKEKRALCRIVLRFPSLCFYKNELEH